MPLPSRLDLGGFPRAFWVLFAGTLVNRLGLVVLPFLTLYLTQEGGLSVERAGVTLGLYGAGAFAAGFVGGALADRVGRRPVLLGSLAGGAVAISVIPFVDGFVPLAGAVFAFGLISDCYRPAVSTAVADLVPEERRTRAYALIYWAINLGAAIGPALGGLLAEAVGFRALFIVDAVAMLSYAAIVLVGVPETRPESDPAEAADRRSRAAAPSRMRQALADGGLMGLALVTFSVGTFFMQAYTTLPLAMAEDGLGAAAYGLAIMVNGGVIVVVSLPLARWAEAYVGPRLLALAIVLIGVGVGLQSVTQTLAAYVAAIVVWTLGEILFIPILPVLVARISPEHLRGTYQGVYHAGWGLAKMSGPVLGGLVFGAFGSAVLWQACLALGLATALGVLATGLGEPRAAPAPGPA